MARNKRKHVLRNLSGNPPSCIIGNLRREDYARSSPIVQYLEELEEELSRYKLEIVERFSRVLERIIDVHEGSPSALLRPLSHRT